MRMPSKTSETEGKTASSKAAAYHLSRSASHNAAFQFADRRSSTVEQRKLQSIMDLGTIQRYVMRRTSPEGWVYYSSYDPSTTYGTEEEAQEADEELEKKHRGGLKWEEGTRFPTLYSYTHIGTSNQLSDKPQGPHTAPHILVDQAFGKLQFQEEFIMVFYEQVPTPDDVKKILETEKGKGFGNQSFEMGRFLYDYDSLYNVIETALWTGGDFGYLQLLIRMMLERHPYATYAWKSKTPASKRSLKNKSENRNAKFREAVDTGGKFSDPKGYNQYLDQREKLVEGKHNLSMEDVEFDGQLDGEYMSQMELVEAVIYGQEVVGNTINLYPTGEWVIQRIEIIYNHLDVPVNAKIRLQRKGG
jgi:hypothetical protein